MAASAAGCRWRRSIPICIAAFVAVEDRRFYRHPGVDLRAAGSRGAWPTCGRAGSSSGASTITMQLARLLRPSARTWRGQGGTGALGAPARATPLEAGDPRAVPQSGAAGPGHRRRGSRGRALLRRSAAELSLGQAALLAGLARAPSGDNPLVSPRRARRPPRRRRSRGCVTGGFATPATVARARRRAAARARRGRRLPRAALHHAAWRSGTSGQPARAGTGAVRTSLDLALQLELEAEVRHTVETLADRGREPGGGGRARQRDRRGPGLGRLARFLGRHGGPGGHGRLAAPARARRSSRSSTRSRSTAATRRRRFCPTSRASIRRRPAPTVRATTTAASTDRSARARRWRARTTCPPWSWPTAWAPAACSHLLREAGFASLDRSAEYYGLGLALGNGDVTLLELANGYRALAQRRRLAPVALARGRARRGGRSRAIGSSPPDRRRWCSTSSTIRSPAFRASASRRRSTFPSPSRRRPAPAVTSPTTGRWE